MVLSVSGRLADGDSDAKSFNYREAMAMGMTSNDGGSFVDRIAIMTTTLSDAWTRMLRCGFGLGVCCLPAL